MKTDPIPTRPDPEQVAKTMRHKLNLAEGFDFDINLVTCGFDSGLYARLKVEEKYLNDDLDFTMVDYVPLTPSEVTELVGMDASPMLRRIEKISKGKDCITSTRGVFRWACAVIYPHT